MRFVVSSSELLESMSSAGKVIATKTTVPIIENFLFEVEGNKLTVVGTDMEVTVISSVELSSSDGDGRIAMPAKLLTDTFRKIPELPVTFDIDLETLDVVITAGGGEYRIVGVNGDDFPQVPELKDNDTKITINGDKLLKGISKTIFACADDTLRPIINGVLVEYSESKISYVASDISSLVCYHQVGSFSQSQGQFVLGKKPANILKSILAKYNDIVSISYDKTNAVFHALDFSFVCRLIEGVYPSYNSIIPTDNPYKIVVDRSSFINSLQQVMPYSSQSSSLVKFNIYNDSIEVTARDLDFSTSARVSLPCQYSGEEVEIGFRSTEVLELVESMECENLEIELGDKTRAAVFVPVDKIEDEDELLLSMPLSL